MLEWVKKLCSNFCWHYVERSIDVAADNRYLHSKKEKVTLTLLRLSQLQPYDTMSLPIELSFLLYLIACVQCAGCPQSITRVMFAMVGT